MSCRTAQPDGDAPQTARLSGSREIVRFEVLVVRCRGRRGHRAVYRAYLLKQALRRAYRCGLEAVGKHLRSLNDKMGVIAHRAYGLRSFAAHAGMVPLCVTDDRS